MVVIGIIAAAIVVCVTSRWWVEGLLSGQEMIILSLVYGGLVFGLFAADELWMRLFVLLLLLASAGWAIYRFKMEGIRQYYRDKIRVYETAIQADPKNLGARSGLAEAYYHLGDLDQAIAAMELAVQSGASAIKESHVLRRWQEERDLRDSKTITCRNCRSKNLWGCDLCRICRMPLVYPADEGGTGRSATRTYANYYAIGASWLIISATMFVLLPPGQAGMIAVCTALAVVGWMLLAS